MGDSRCPEPKPVLIFFLSLGGAVALLAGAAIDDATTSPYHKMGSYAYPERTLKGTVIGLAVGTGLALSRRSWIRCVGASVIALAGFVVAQTAFYLVSWGDDGVPAGIPVWKFTVFEAVTSAAPIAFLFCALHHFLLKGRRWEFSAIFIIVGMVSMMIVPVEGEGFALLRFPIVGEVGWDIYGDGAYYGALFGLLQCLAMQAALAVDRRTKLIS